MTNAPSPDDPLIRKLSTLAFETSSDAIGMLSLDGTILLLNAAGMSAFVFSADEGAVPRKWFDLWDFDGCLEAISAVARAREGKRSLIRCRQSAATDASRTWENTIAPIADADGVITQLMVTSRDVTAEHEAVQALDRSARLHKALIEATSEIVWHFDVASGVTDRRGWFDFTGQRDDAADANDWLSFLHPNDRAQARISTDRAMLEARPLRIEYRLRHHSDEWRWVNDHATPLLRDDGSVSDWVGIITDIHDRRTAEDAVRASEQRLRLAVEATGLATWEMDAATGRQSWSPELFEMLEIARDTPPSHDAFLERVHAYDRKRVRTEFETSLSTDIDAGTSTFRIQLRCGEERWIEGRNRVFRDEAGHALRHIGTMQDITDRKRAEQTIWLAAYQDSLTKAANRAHFQICLDAAIETASERGGSVGLIMVDLDNFKDINDALGHDAGDALLRVTVERLKAACPLAATVARFGGDEFGIVIPLAAGDVSFADTVETCLSQLRLPIEHNGHSFNCTASLGWSLFPDHDAEPTALLKNADLALYAVKAAGRNHALPFDPAMRTEARRRIAVLQRAREALGRQAIIPFYQPKVSLLTGEVLGFEALLRWTDERGLRTPGEISEAFDDRELALRMGKRMLDCVVSDMRVWAEGGIPFGHVALNVGEPEFRCDEEGNDLFARVSQSLGSAGLSASRLHIEITERVLLYDGAELVADTLFRLHEAGVQIALDDFGTGYASLAHLQRYPVSYIKIDRSFVGQMEADKGALAIVRALAGLAKNLGMATVAEGAETSAQVDMLRQANCDTVQGYVFGKPMAASRVRNFLATFREKRLRDHRPKQIGIGS